MVKSVFMSVAFFAFITSNLFSVGFLQFCQLVKSNKANSDISHTVNVLLTKTGSEDCKFAFDYLRGLRILDLSRNKIKSIKPLYGLENLEGLDLSGNEIEDLWGIEYFKKLRMLFLSVNKIRNIVPLFFLDSLQMLSLDRNNIANLMPLKNHPYLDRIAVRLFGNPFCEDVQELQSFVKMQWYREASSHGIYYNKDFLSDQLIDIIKNKNEYYEKKKNLNNLNYRKSWNYLNNKILETLNEN